MLNKLYNKPSTYYLKVFNGECWWSVNLKFPGKEKKPDCLVSHPQRNLTFRTQRGLQVKKYNTFNELIYDIKEEAKKYNLDFSKYKIIKLSLHEPRRVIKSNPIFKKIKINDKNITHIMRIVCDSNNLNNPYSVTGFICDKKFKLKSVLKGPIPLVSVLNQNNNFCKLKGIVANNYHNLKRFDYKNRGYKYFSKPKPSTAGFLVPLKWFNYIKYTG